MTFLPLLSLALLTQAPIDAGPSRLHRVGRLDHAEIREPSGLVASRRHPGIYWTHNDSGNPPRLFAVRRDGSLVRAYRVAAPNVDWEDIATDDQGHLYIGEIGNNDGLLPVRAIYQLDEPDPTRPGPDTLPVTTASYYRFAPGDRFDAEALSIDGDRALVVAKTHDKRDARVYAIPLRPPAPLLRPALPRPDGTLPGFTSAVTGADLDASGRLVVVSLDHLAVYARKGEDAWGLVGRVVKFRVDDQIEAVAWDRGSILLTGEQRGVYVPRDAELARLLGPSPSRRGGEKPCEGGR